MKKFIKKTTTFNYAEKNACFIHIAYGIDDNYTRCTGSSIASFCLNNPRQNFQFHIITNDLSISNIEKFKLLAKKHKINIIIYEVDITILNNLPTQVHLSIATYFRFLLPFLLENVDKLFYIDADIICLKNTDTLFNVNLDNYIIAAVPDVPALGKKRSIALGLDNHTYFNAGMIIINIKKWIEFNTFNKVLNSIQKNPKLFRYLDQDALNLVLHNHILYLDNKYNFIDNNYTDKSDIVLLHFAAHPKPWNIAFPISNLCTTFNKNLYQKYETLTPWKAVPLETPKNYKEFKIYAKALKHNKQYIKSYYNYIKYLIYKIKN